MRPLAPPSRPGGRRLLPLGAAVGVGAAALVALATLDCRRWSAPPWASTRQAASEAAGDGGGSVDGGAECDPRRGYCGVQVRECRDPPPPPSDHPASRNGRPLVVVAAGGSRSASTWVYNVARVLLRERDPNTVAGWYEDLAGLVAAYAEPGGASANAATGGGALESLRSLDTSVLIKVHLVQEWATLLGGEAPPRPFAPPSAWAGWWGWGGGTAPEPPLISLTELSEGADVVLTSHRDLREVVRSLRHMGWGTRVNPAAFDHPDFCRRPHDPRWAPPPVGAAGYADAAVWVNMARAHILCRDRLLASAGARVVLDVPAEVLAGPAAAATRLRHIRTIAAALDWPYTEAELEGVVTEVARLRVPPCTPEGGSGVRRLVLNPTTHIHRGHIRLGAANVEAVDAAGVAAIEADPVCRAWLVKHGYMEGGGAVEGEAPEGRADEEGAAEG